MKPILFSKQLRFSIEDTTKLELPYYNPELYGIMHRRKESKERYPLEQRNIEETINTPVLYCNYCGKPLEFYLRQDYKDKPYSYCHNHIYLEFINILKGEDI